MSTHSTSLRLRVREWILTSKGILASLSIGLLLVLPLILSDFQLFILGSVLLLATLAVTWDFFTGLSGYFNFGHMFLVALGGYSSVLLEAEVGLSIWTSILLATVITTVVGTVVIAGPSLRLSGIYFAVITLIVAIWGENLVILFSDTTGGLGGYIFVADLGFRLSKVVPFDASDDVLLYYLALGNFLVITGFLITVAKSDLGTVLRAIHQDETLLASLGVNPTKFKVVGFGLTAMFTGYTGAIWTHSITTLTPSTQLSIGTMIDILVASVIGGMGTLVGPALGMGILEFLDWALTTIQSSAFYQETLGSPFNVTEYRRVIWMSIALAFFYFWPRGIYPVITKTIRRLDPRGGGGGDE